MDRRTVLLSGVAGLGIVATGLTGGQAQSRAKNFEVSLTPEEWKEKLTPEQFYVLRREGTERPFTSPLNDNKEIGTYHCAGCDQGIYRSETKYDSKTGWPSFWDNIEGMVGTTVDYKLIYPRTEVHCARCGGHLGHIFDDGPKPTGKRHCLNGVALTFMPDKAAG